MKTAKSYGKCILAGEHTVLRGGSALVWPLKFLQVTATWIKGSKGIWVQTSPEPSLLPESKPLWQLIEPYNPEGNGILLTLSEMFLGQGLGGSAAIAVSIARLLEVPNVFMLAQKIENLIHGKSSGADVAGALASLPIQYNGPSIQKTLEITWKPLLFLSNSGEKSATSTAIKHVQSLHTDHPIFAHEVDAQMIQAVNRILLGLQSRDQATCLTEGIIQAGDCFQKWRLVSQAMEKHMAFLKKAGAIAVKPTGAGLGGSILSLWKQLPPQDFGLKKIGVPS